MTLLWLAIWFVLGMPKPEMFGTRWDFLGVTLAISVVVDSAWLRDWLRNGRRSFVSRARVGHVGWFLGNYAGMGIAMILGMLALGPVIGFLMDRGFPYLNYTYPDIHLLAMALFMTIPMVVGMLFRGYGLERMAEMAGVMFGPALLVIAASAVGLLSQMTMLDLGHALMWVAMLVLMLWRWSEYSQFVRRPARIDKITHPMQPQAPTRAAGA